MTGMHTTTACDAFGLATHHQQQQSREVFHSPIMPFHVIRKIPHVPVQSPFQVPLPLLILPPPPLWVQTLSSALGVDFHRPDAGIFKGKRSLAPRGRGKIWSPEDWSPLFTRAALAPVKSLIIRTDLNRM